MESKELLTLIGDSGTGKSSLLRVFTNSPFTEEFYETIGIDFVYKDFYFEDNKHKYRLWDTSSKPGFIKFWKKCLVISYALIIVFDLTNRYSYDRLTFWAEYAQECISNWEIIIFVGNKSDLKEERTVAYEEGIETAMKFGGVYIECSAKTKQGVEELFYIIFHDKYFKNIYM